MVGNPAGRSQTRRGTKDSELNLRLLLYWGVVQSRIKSHAEQQAEQARREEQTRIFRRNQVFGLLIFAAAICVWWLFHTNPKWIFPPGWWRW